MTALSLSETDYDVLNVVVLKKMATADAVAAAAGVDAGRVGAVLDALAGYGLVAVAGGAALPTDTAEPALRGAAAQRYAATRADGDVLALVDRFETVNAQFLTTMSAWQQVDVGGRKVANDHTDPDYDAKIVDRLDRLVARLRPLLDALAGYDARFGRYGERFAAALAAVDAGDHDLVSSPVRDSVHNIWFEFHEDLLRTLGRERTE
ncbi:MAG: helix-turn-helix domain-containing protein [Pseudonocardia sp.]